MHVHYGQKPDHQKGNWIRIDSLTNYGFLTGNFGEWIGSFLLEEGDHDIGVHLERDHGQ